jgi:hypothetical protein
LDGGLLSENPSSHITVVAIYDHSAVDLDRRGDLTGEKLVDIFLNDRQ